MNAYLIDPVARTITAVDYTGKYTNIYDHIEADCFDLVRINCEGDAIFVDDEGLLKDDQSFFMYEGYPSPLAGRGLVLGSDEEGESVSPKITLEELKANVSFGAPVRFNDELVWLHDCHAA